VAEERRKTVTETEKWRKRTQTEE